MKIYITGNPGTGKSAIGAEISKNLDIPFQEIREVVEENNLWDEYERERDTKIFDVDKTINFLLNHLRELHNFILIGPPLPITEINFTYIIVLTCSKRSVLSERLKKRKYLEKKVKENIEAEFLGEVLGNVLDWWSEKNICIYDTCNHSLTDNVKSILRILNKQ